MTDSQIMMMAAMRSSISMMGGSTWPSAQTPINELTVYRLTEHDDGGHEVLDLDDGFRHGPQHKPLLTS